MDKAGRNTLDQASTNLKETYKIKSTPSLGNSDHMVIGLRHQPPEVSGKKDETSQESCENPVMNVTVDNKVKVFDNTSKGGEPAG